MTTADMRRRFLALRVWNSNHSRAPHKPLLALWAIGRCLRGQPRMAPFDRVDRELGELLRRFGPPRKQFRTEFPFWRLVADRVWEIDHPQLASVTASGDAHRSSLRKWNLHGGLLAADYQAFQADPRLAREIADSLIDAHFPQTYRDDLLRATGIAGVQRPRTQANAALEVRDEQWQPPPGEEQSYEVSRRLRRHGAFRPAVLAAYSAQCAVCAFDVRLAGEPVAVEAAHIHWHRDAGPADVRNGLALCVMHHRLFDRGMFTVLANYQVFVVGDASGTGVHEALLRFHEQRLRVLPERIEQRPDPSCLRWHAREVFRAPNAVLSTPI